MCGDSHKLVCDRLGCRNTLKETCVRVGGAQMKKQTLQVDICEVGRGEVIVGSEKLWCLITVTVVGTGWRLTEAD